VTTSFIGSIHPSLLYTSTCFVICVSQSKAGIKKNLSFHWNLKPAFHNNQQKAMCTSTWMLLLFVATCLHSAQSYALSSTTTTATATTNNRIRSSICTTQTSTGRAQLSTPVGAGVLLSMSLSSSSTTTPTAVSASDMDTDKDFSTFAESLKQDGKDNNNNKGNKDTSRKEQSWQEVVDELLDPVTPLARRQELLAKLVNANREIQVSVLTAMRERKVRMKEGKCYCS